MEDEKAGYMYRLIVDGYNWSQPAFEHLIINVQDKSNYMRAKKKAPDFGAFSESMDRSILLSGPRRGIPYNQLHYRVLFLRAQGR